MTEESRASVENGFQLLLHRERCSPSAHDGTLNPVEDGDTKIVQIGRWRLMLVLLVWVIFSLSIDTPAHFCPIDSSNSESLRSAP